MIKKHGMFTIDKEEIDALLAAKNFIGLNRSPRSEKVIVSLTSYLPRIHDVKYTIYSLLNQNFPPDKLILWLDEDSFPQREENLPPDLLDLQNFGLTIDWCENIRPYKKLIPALEKYPDDIIVTADDDIFYRPDWLKILYDEHLSNPDCVIAHRAHRIRLDAQGNIYPYTEWQKEIFSTNLFCGNFVTSGAGALYAKKFFHADILRRELFLELSPLADDIWLWAMTLLNDTKNILPPAAQRELIYTDVDTQQNSESLYDKNQNENNIQFRRVIEKYPALYEKLIRETATFKPCLSVVLPIKDEAAALECFENIFAQNFPDFELIIINLGARVEFPPLPTNFQVVNYPGGTFADAFNLGLQKAAGEYILFTAENSLFAEGSLGIIAEIARDFAADVIHFSAHARFADKEIILDDALQFEKFSPVLFEETRQKRALFWFKNKLSRRLDTKIFKREFLLRHAINFDDDIPEFLFHALIQAGKYLIVPQAFCLCREQNGQ